VDALADRNQAFFAHEVAAWTRGRRSVKEVGIELLHHWFLPEEPPPAIIRSEVLGVVPLEVTDALLDTFRGLADRHERSLLAPDAAVSILTAAYLVGDVRHKRTHNFAIDGWRRPGQTTICTALPRCLLTRKRSQVQTLSRPPHPL
jgi:hypothetical protein